MKSKAMLAWTLVLGCILFSPATAQWLDTLIQFSDSLGCLRAPAQVLANPLTGRVYVTSVDGVQGGVLTFDPATLEKHRPFSGGYDRAIFCPGVDKVYLGGRYSEDVRVIDARADTTVRTFYSETLGELSGMAYSQTSRKLYLSFDYPESLALVVLDAEADTLIGGYSFQQEPTGLFWDSVHNGLYVAGTNDTISDILVFDCAGDTLVGVVPIDGEYVYSFAAKPSARKLYCGEGVDGQVIHVLDVDSLRELRTIETDGASQLLLYNPAYDRLYVCSPEDYFLTIVDAATDSIRRSLELELSPTSIAMNPNDGRVYLGTYDELWVTVVDSTDTIADTIQVARGTPELLAFSAPRNELYSALSDDYAAVIDGSGDTVKAYLDYIYYQIRNLIHNPAGNKLYLLMTDEDIVRVLGPDNRVLRDIPVGLVDSRPYPVLNPALNRLYVADRDVLWVIDCNADSLLRSMPMNGVDDPIALLYADLNRIFIFPRRGTGNIDVVVFDCLRDSFVARIGVSANTPCAAYQPAANRFYCGLYSTTVPTLAVIDPVTCVVTAQLAAGGRSRGMRMFANPDNGLVYVANDHENLLYIFDSRADTLVDTVPLVLDADTVFWNRALNKAYLCNSSTTCVLDCNTNTFIDSIPVGVYHAGLMNDRNDKLYLGSASGVNIVDCRNDSLIASLGGIGGPYSFAWNLIDNRVYASKRTNELAVYRDDLVGIAGEPQAVKVGLTLAANPVRGRARFRCQVPVGQTAILTLHDVLGRVVSRQFVGGGEKPIALTWAGTDVRGRRVPAGIYFARLEATGQRATVKVVLE